MSTDSVDWKESPEGTTHLDPHDFSNSKWIKEEDGVWYYWSGPVNDGDAGRWEKPYSQFTIPSEDNLIARYKQEDETHQSVEFPTGTGVLIVADPDVNGVVIVRDESGEYRRVAKDNVKPLRTKEQRERAEELADFIKHSGACWSKDIAAAILSRYELKERNQ